ncbi:MAG: hypothetical protein C0469_07725 [Cyanobacteria bacterium DS2.3.42]|nr:hypothetical protein [Cyanobacteria bacterium DS2.3.42]
MTKILKRLTQSEINKIAAQKPIFQRAQDLTGVPWRAIATIWYRETFSVAPPTHRVGGQFQFDPPPSDESLMYLLHNYTKVPTMAEKEALVKSGIEYFTSAAIFAACWLRHKSKFVLTIAATDEHIKDAFYGYNGRAYKDADHSPYVMNYFDEDHYEMRIYGTVRDAKGNNIRLKDKDGKDGVPNKQIGAFVVYKQLQQAIKD